MLWRGALAAAFLFSLAACSEATTTTSTSAPPPDPGRLVVIDGSGDIVVLSPDGTGELVVAEADDSVFTQPVWSPDGESLAWGQVTSGSFAMAVAEEVGVEASLVPMSNLPFFSYWSPDGRHIGVLHNGSDGIDFQIVDVETASSSLVGRGAPYYFSWSPESDEVVVHVGAQTFDLIDLAGNRTSLGDTDPGYLAPQWTVDGILHVVEEDLVLRAPSGDGRTVGAVGDFALFVANPQATRVALQSSGGDAGLTVGLTDVQAAPGSLQVLDVESGQTERVTDDPALGFFWSPNGESLMILELAEVAVSVSVWTAGSGVQDYGVFRPSQVVLETMLPFFPQYAQSVSFWSPDSSAFAYAANDGIWVQELGQSEPVRVSEGSWVAWSS